MADEPSIPDDLRTTMSFGSGFVVSRSRARVIVQFDALRDLGEADNFVLEWTEAAAAWRIVQHVEWTAIRHWILDQSDFRAFTLGVMGEVAVEDAAGNVSEEQIDPTLEGPAGYGPLRDLRALGGRIAACGMSRRVYSRLASGSWQLENGSVAQPPDDVSVKGFNALDGSDLANLLAVGFDGEIWRRKEGIWSWIESPTNVILHRVRLWNAERAFACGQLGVVLEGQRDSWRVVPHDVTEEDLWGMEIFNDAVYLASEGALFRLEPGGTLQPIDTGLGDGFTYRHLHANDGSLWSFGPRHVARSNDGQTWTDVTP